VIWPVKKSIIPKFSTLTSILSLGEGEDVKFVIITINIGKVNLAFSGCSLCTGAVQKVCKRTLPKNEKV
jgi:hypothetical protein